MIKLFVVLFAFIVGSTLIRYSHSKRISSCKVDATSSFNKDLFIQKGAFYLGVSIIFMGLVMLYAPGFH